MHRAAGGGQGVPRRGSPRTHLSPTGARAAAWLREHPEDPASNLPHDDDELAGLIAELVILAHDEPASAEAMELNFLLLEQRRLEAEIAAAGEPTTTSAAPSSAASAPPWSSA